MAGKVEDAGGVQRHVSNRERKIAVERDEKGEERPKVVNRASGLGILFTRSVISGNALEDSPDESSEKFFGPKHLQIERLWQFVSYVPSRGRKVVPAFPCQ